MFWPSLLMTGDMWAAQADHFGDRYQRHPGRPAGPRREPKAHGDIRFRRLRPLHRRHPRRRSACERTHFVGNSWGGMIGGTFAATYPDRIGSAVLMNCTASPAGTRQKIEYGFLLRDGEAARRNPAAADPIGAQGVPRADDVRHPARRRRVRAGHGAGGRHRFGVLGGEERGAGPAGPAFAASRTSRRRCWSSRVPRTRRSRCPRPSRWPRRYPDAAVAVLEGVAHLAALENPPLVNKLIEEFVFRE